MDGKKLLKNAVWGSFFWGSCLLNARPEATNNVVTDDFWLNDLGLTHKDRAFCEECGELPFNLKEQFELDFEEPSRDRKLRLAVDFGNKPLVKCLLNEGIDANSTFWRNTTPLYISVFVSTGMARLLLNRGANPNLGDDKGRSALHVAAVHSSLKMVELLLDEGADPNLKDKKGDTPFMFIVDTINNFEALEDDHQRRYLSRIKHMPRYLSPRLRSYFKRDNLYTVIKSARYIPIMKLLMKHGALPNAQNNHGNTALHRAVSEPRFTSMHQNVSKMWYCQFKDYPSLELLEELIKLGVDVNIRNRDGNTVLDLVRQRKKTFLAINKADIYLCNRIITDFSERRQTIENFYHKGEVVSDKFDQIIAFLRKHGAIGHPREEIESQFQENSEDEFIESLNRGVETEESEPEVEHGEIITFLWEHGAVESQSQENGADEFIESLNRGVEDEAKNGTEESEPEVEHGEN
jgi:ankyrin repeat protein